MGSIMPRQSDTSSHSSQSDVTAKIVKLAERMLIASRVVANGMPAGFSPSSPINFLLELFLAEEGGQYLSIDDVGKNDQMSKCVAERWIAALIAEGFVERSGQAIGLTDRGFQVVTSMLTRLFESQRLLD